MSALSSSKFSSSGNNTTLQTDSHTAGSTATERPEMFPPQNAEFSGILVFYSPLQPFQLPLTSSRLFSDRS